MATMKSMTKNMTAQKGANSIRDTALGYTMNARPGPEKDNAPDD